MRNSLSLVERLDRTLSGGFFKQVKWLLGFTILVFAILIGVSFLFPDSNEICGIEGKLDRIKGIIYLMIDPGNVSLETDNAVGIQLFTGVVAALGMVLLGGLLISTLTNVVERRVSDVEDGNVVYSSMRDHYVIIGYGSLVVSIVRNIYSKESETGKRIVILTSQNVRSARADLFAQIPSSWEQYIHFYSGNIESNEHISSLNVDSAVEIYILGENEEYGRDSKNLECVRQIAQLRANCKNIINLNVQFDKLTSYSLIQKISLPLDFFAPNGNVSVYFRPFNHYENWARILWGFNGGENFGYDNLDFEPVEGDKYVHLVIAGFNRMGRALFLEAMRQCHYPNFDERTRSVKSRITIVDKGMDAVLPEFRSQYPYLDQISDIEIEFINSTIEDEGVRRMLAEESKNNNALLTVAICLEDSDASLSAGLCLPDEVFYTIEDGKVINSNTRVLIRQSIIQEGIGRILRSGQTKYSNVHIFGMADRGISPSLMNDDLPSYINAFYQTKYGASDDSPVGQIYKQYETYLNQAGIPLDTSFIDLVIDPVHHEFMHQIARGFWVFLNESHRFANRDQVDMYHTYMKYNCSNFILEQMEHLRWNADRSIVGYKYVDKGSLEKAEYKKKDVYKFHGDIIPFYDLGVIDLEKDSDMIVNMKLLTQWSLNK